MKQTIKIIAIFLCVVLCLGIFAHLSGVFDPSIKINKSLKLPDNASSDFNGVLLSSYDSVSLNVYNDVFVVDFEDVYFDDYQYIVVDFIDSRFHPLVNNTGDFSLVCKYGDINGIINHKITFNNTLYSHSGVFGTFIESSVVSMYKDYSYILDMSDLASSSKIQIHAFYDGIYKYTYQRALDVNANNYLDSWKCVASGHNENNNYPIIISGVNVYAFEGESSLKDCIGDNGLSLYECKDSLLYGTNNI